MPDRSTREGRNDFIGNVTSTNFFKSDSELLTGLDSGLWKPWAINDKVSVGVEYRIRLWQPHLSFRFNEGVIFPGDTKVSLETDQVTCI